MTVLEIRIGHFIKIVIRKKIIKEIYVRNK